jgi:hypothetical protein
VCDFKSKWIKGLFGISSDVSRYFEKSFRSFKFHNELIIRKYRYKNIKIYIKKIKRIFNKRLKLEKVNLYIRSEVFFFYNILKYLFWINSKLFIFLKIKRN